jgi:putative ABC transport system ATP-binding protein
LKVLLENIKVKIPGTDKLLFEIKQFKAEKGERILIKGPSGIGKTTLLHLIAGLFLPDKGSVQLDKYNLNELSDSARSTLRRKSIGIIFQKLNLIEHLTAFENVLLQVKGKDSYSKAEDSIVKVNMKEFSGILSSNLSLGEQQRIAVGRVLAADPSLVLADEPTSSLDEVNAANIINSLFSLPDSSTIITVSHDDRIVNKFNRVINFTDLIKK